MLKVSHLGTRSDVRQSKRVTGRPGGHIRSTGMAILGGPPKTGLQPNTAISKVQYQTGRESTLANTSSAVHRRRKAQDPNSRPRPRPARLIVSPMDQPKTTGSAVNYSYRGGMMTAPEPSMPVSNNLVSVHATAGFAGANRPSSRPASRGTITSKPAPSARPNRVLGVGTARGGGNDVNHEEVRNFLESWNSIGRQPGNAPAMKSSLEDMLVISMSPIHLTDQKKKDVSRLGDFEAPTTKLPYVEVPDGGSDMKDQTMASLFAGGGAVAGGGPANATATNIVFNKFGPVGPSSAKVSRPISRGRFRAARGVPYGVPVISKRRAATSVPRSRRNQGEANMQGMVQGHNIRRRPATGGMR